MKNIKIIKTEYIYKISLNIYEILLNNILYKYKLNIFTSVPIT